MFNTNIIKEIRNKNNKTQSEVAKDLNVTRSSYAMWESNNNIFPLKRLLDFCEIFNVSLDYIFGLNKNNYLIKEKINYDKIKMRFKEFRKNNNLTQEMVTAFLHIDQPTWSIYERGKSLIGTPFLYMICKKYNVSADYLLGRVDFDYLSKLKAPI